MVSRLILIFAPAVLLGQNLMPWPAQMTAGQGRLAISESFRIEVRPTRDPRVAAGAARLATLLGRITGMPLPGSGAAPALLVEAGAANDDDESYRLSIKPEGARLTAPGAVGALRGMASFAQLVELGGDGFGIAAGEIQDRPRFPWRGLLLDVARHWMPMDVVKRTLDGMAAVKLNVLHLHLSDDQGFRVESKRYPKLHLRGSDGHYFTQDQIREILAYARDRGIRVVPEFDMPGHTTSWFVGYPELASAPGPYSIERAWGVKDPCMDPTREEVYRFIDGFVGEMSRLFPDPWFHIGGDEVNGKQWNANARIRDFKKARDLKNNQALQAYFTRRVQEIVKKHGKRMIGWDEILHPDSPRDILVQSWRGQKSLAEAAAQGYQAILSNGYYLDLSYPASRHYLVDPMTRESEALTDEQKQRILGGEACMWSEMVSAENVDGRIWPRAAVIAERLWSPQHIRDVESMYRRMDAVSRELEWVGLTHASTYRKMLERLSGGVPYTAVPPLVALVEPVKGYRRGKARKYTVFTPLNRVVDTALPESAAARRFADSVDRFLEDGTGAESLRRTLTTWRDNDARMQPAIRNSALLAEMESISAALRDLAAAGIEALDHITKKEHVPAWVESQKAVLARAAQPHAELLLGVVAPVRKLIEAAR